MYIENIKIKNYGAIENIDFKAKFAENGNPLPILLIGKNGTGKTLFLSQILDAFVEMKKKAFTQKMPELSNNNEFLRILDPSYITSGEICTYSIIDLKSKESKKITYKSFISRISKEDIKKETSIISELKRLEVDSNKGNYKDLNPIITGDNKLWDEGVLLYFPHSRYDHPKWLRNDASLGFEFNDKYTGISNSSFIKTNIIEETKKWLLDCFLDREVYEKKPISIDPYYQYRGRNTNIINLINKSLTSVFSFKFQNLTYARLGLSQKHNRAISLELKQTTSKNEKTIAPSLDFLSSGEIMILSLISSILKDADEKMLITDETNLTDLKGIVVIDEIDLHSHLQHQKELLPKLIKMFPKIQFVLSTHSPFFLLGMREELQGNYTTINMPTGDEIDLNDFSEIQQAYKVFNNGIENLQNNLIRLNLEVEELKKSSKHILITEGKTDWKHLKIALEKLKDNGDFLDLPEFEFLEYGDDIQMGSSSLKGICESYEKISNNRKIIGIFDRDEKNILRDMGDGDNEIPYKNKGNNIYTFCIPTPSHRENHYCICIEHYYKDADLQRKDNNDRKIFLSTEFSPKGVCKLNKNLRLSNYQSFKSNLIENCSKIIDKEVIDEDGNNLALSKSDFAMNVMNETENFKDFDFSEFKKIFKILDEILKS